MTTRKSLSNVERFHPLEGYVGRVVVEEPYIEHPGSARHICLRRNEGDLVTLFK